MSHITISDKLHALDIKTRGNCSMASYTGFKAGGEVALAVFPQNVEELIEVLRITYQYRDEMPTYIVGYGSNILFSDGVKNCVAVITKNIKNTYLSKINADDSVEIYSECGASLTHLAGQCANNAFLKSIGIDSDRIALSGLEFAYGIPGSVGGAVAMNAGAYGGEMKDVVVYTDVYDMASGKRYTICGDGHDFTYRHSIFSSDPKLCVLGTTIKLIPKSREEVKVLMDKNMSSRKEKQPLEYPSCGSTFLRPENRFVGQMTEEAGLKGYRIGGAELSKKHGGFVINAGGATATDILMLIDHIKKVIYEKYAVELECEIKIID